MFVAVIALALSGTVATEKSPDDIVCRTKYDMRTKMRSGKICKTRAEWEGKYAEEDAAADADAVKSPAVAEQVATPPKPRY
ncbi:hypothetical protein [Sphingomonas sp.]|uniref:hypothetical protein n=1 Tax=Sphingomonas sp. TaxID=28214 RepID=UPI001ECE8A13|nr:hypothetical protein [Sphingomonas sp.]MBX3593508.1 hypothetical protein [Sphingomonas sp.]